MLGEAVRGDVVDRLLQLIERHLALVRENQCLVLDLGDWLALDRAQDRRRGHRANLRIDRPEHRVLAHHDLVGGERDQRSARHGVVGHEHRHLARVPRESARDLRGWQSQAAGRVEN